MARAVARQRQVPYALIVFVFLFVIAAVVAVMMFTKNDANLVLLDELQTKLDQFVTSAQLRDDQSILARLEKHRTDPDHKTVTQQYDEELKLLATYLAGTDDASQAAADYEVWKKEMFENKGSQYYKHLDDTGLLSENKGSSVIAFSTFLADRWLESFVEADQATDKALDLDDRIGVQANTNRALSDQINEAVAEMRDDFAERETEYLEQLQMKDATIASLQSRMDDLGETNSETMGQKTEQINRLSKQVSDLETDVAMLNAEIARLKTYDLNEGQVVFPDGEVTRVVDAETCYINLGSNNGILPDMQFSIYTSNDDQIIDGAKAKLVVKRVLDDSSQCAIVDANPRNPVVQGDIIANIAYDQNLPHLFVVIGDFDLSGGDYPTKEEADKVKALIKKYGGEITDTIDSNTDFVIMGHEPEQPTEPLDDDQINWTNYYRAQREYDEYHDARAKALDMQIRVLNTNRFLERIGYVPSKTLTYEED
jgi:multidrug efflux pump subunit AcrA (membrane-fusion protein)